MSSSLISVDAEEKAEILKKRLDVEEKAEILKKRRIDIVSSFSFQIPYGELNIPFKLDCFLPCLSKAFQKSDLSSLQNFVLKGSKYLDHKDAYALENEVVALCVWFLFAKSTTAEIKELLVYSLKCYIFDEMSTDVSADEASLEDLVVRVLDTNNTEVIRQLCYALHFSLNINRKNLSGTFGVKILDQLLKFVYKDNDKELAWSIIHGIIGVVGCYNGTFDYYIMPDFTDEYLSCNKEKRMKLVNAEFLKPWVVGFLERYSFHVCIMADVCWTVSFMVSEEYDETLWDHVIGKIVPVIVKLVYEMDTQSIALSFAVGNVIHDIVRQATSFQIRTLVDMQCLRLLLHCCEHGEPEKSRDAIEAIKLILEAGDDVFNEVFDEDWERCDDEIINYYAQLIDDYKPGWEVLFFRYHMYCTMDDGYELVLKYRPHLS